MSLNARVREPLVADVLAIAAIVAATLIVGLPSLRGDLGAYLDIPVHLEEVADLARPDGTGWTDLGLCGFPVHMVQSPLLYGGLAAMARWGWPLPFVFALLTVSGLALPPLAFYAMARRRMGAALALAASATLFFYRGAVVGIASSLGGMFGFQFAAALLIVVLDRFARPSRDLRDVAILATLGGLIGLMHIWVTFTLVLLALVHGVSSLRTKAGRQLLRFDVPALGLGCLAAAAYWLPNVLAPGRTFPEATPLLAPIKRFFTISGAAVSRPGQGALARLLDDPVHGADALVQVAVAVTFLLGVRRLVKSEDRAARYGAYLAALIFTLLLLDSVTHLPLLGPQGFRQVYFMKIGVLAACMPLLASVDGAVQKRMGPVVVVGACVAAFAGAMERIPASVVVPASSVASIETERLWSWLREHREPRWGRVAIQDTAGDDRAPARDGRQESGDAAMLESHVLVETAAHAGVEQLGPYFTGLPAATESWTRSENGLVLGANPQKASFVDDVTSRMKRANATHLVLVDDVTAGRVAHDDRFALDHEDGRYRVFELRGAVSHWAAAGDGSAPVEVARIAPGHMRVDLGGAPAGPLSVAESYHRFWRTEPRGAASIRPSPDGLMVVEPSAGARSFELVYDPPRFPQLLSIAAFLAIAAIAVMHELRRRSSPQGA